MNFRNVALVLSVAGIVLGGAALVISSQNTGSCPLATVGSPPCDHTFPGTTIWIGQTATEVGIIAIVVLVSSVAVASIASLTNRNQR